MNKEKSDRGRKSKDEQLNGELGVGYGVKRVLFSPLCPSLWFFQRQLL